MSDYRAYVLAGGEPKKWKWSSPDKAGTQSSKKVGADGIAENMMTFAKEVFKVDIDTIKRRTKAEEWATATGRRLLYMNPDGFLLNDKAEVVKDYDRNNDVVIKIDYEGNRT